MTQGNDKGISQEVNEAAAAEVINSDKSVTIISKKYGSSHVSLHRSCASYAKTKAPERLQTT
jgi:transposase-like protein